MNLSGVFSQLISLFIMIFVGYFAARMKVITPAFRRNLSTCALSIAAPGTILSSALSSSLPPSDMLGVVILAAVFYVIMIPLALLITRLASPKAQRNLDVQMLVFTNVGFMGIPVVQAVYDQNAVAMVSMFILTFNLAFFSYGVMLVSGEMKINWRSLINPCIFAALGALCCVLTGVRLPAPVHNALATLGSMNTPLAMVVIGASLAHSDLRAALTNLRLYKVAVLRMFLMPAVILFIMRALPIDRTLAGVAVIMAAMPTGGNCAMVSDIYTPGDMTASHAVIVTTLMSAVSLPVICYAMSMFL